MARVTHLLALLVFVFQTVSLSPIPSPLVSLVRFPSLKTLLTSVTDLFTNIHRRSFDLPPEVKMKPSYKLPNAVPVYIPGVMNSSFQLLELCTFNPFQ